MTNPDLELISQLQRKINLLEQALRELCQRHNDKDERTFHYQGILANIKHEMEDTVEIDPSLIALARKMGFGENWKPSHNVRINWKFVISWIPDITVGDFTWLCNQFATALRPHVNDCPNNFRLSHHQESARYRKARVEGCCGEYDVLHTNPRTKNSFWIGYNYGH